MTNYKGPWFFVYIGWRISQKGIIQSLQLFLKIITDSYSNLQKQKKYVCVHVYVCVYTLCVSVRHIKWVM